MRFNDAIPGVVVLLFAAAMLAYTLTFPAQMPGQEYGPALFPGLVAVGLVLCGLLLVARGVRAGGAWVSLGGWTGHPRAAAPRRAGYSRSRTRTAKSRPEATSSP